MKKVILVAAGAVAAGGAVAALGMGPSNADPTSASPMNVLGEPYAKAVAILHAQGIATTFGGSVGSDVPQSQCIVQTQKYLTNGRMQLMLNCTEEAQPAQQPAATSVANSPSGAPGAPSAPAQDPGRPTPGASGVVTVVPTRVG